MNIRPLADLVIVQPHIVEELKTPGGIIIPDTAKEKTTEGKIVAVGPGRVDDDGKLIKMNVKVGDKVLYARHQGTEFECDAVDYIIMHENNILATLECDYSTY